MSSDFWKMGHQATASSLLQDFSRRPEMPCGPEAFLGQMYEKSLATACWSIIITPGSDSGTPSIAVFFSCEKSRVKSAKKSYSAHLPFPTHLTH